MSEHCIEWSGLRFSTGYGRMTNSERVRTGHQRRRYHARKGH